jgi:hypothetical protein
VTISENQLQTWSKQGAVATAEDTHKSIRKALKADDSPLQDKTVEIYLQGSYRNTTNIRGDSDVDVVVELTTAFWSNISALSVSEQNSYHASHSKATYGWNEFRLDVLQALQNYFGKNQIKEGDKALKLQKASGRLGADIVPCLQYRVYQRFYSIEDPEYIPGIGFYAQTDKRLVVNYPRLHYKNGAAKNQKRTNKQYKPTVRMFKNARTYLIAKEVLNDGIAPSYFLECLLYNVPDDLFLSDRQKTFLDILTWLDNTEMGHFVCQNEQIDLFGDTPEQWSRGNAHELIQSLLNLWDVGV